MKIGNCNYVFIVKPHHITRWVNEGLPINCYCCGADLVVGMLCQLKANGAYKGHKRCVACAIQKNILTPEDIKDLKVIYHNEMTGVPKLVV